MVNYKDFHLNTKAQLSFCKAYNSSPEWSESTTAAKLFKILLQEFHSSWFMTQRNELL